MAFGTSPSGWRICQGETQVRLVENLMFGQCRGVMLKHLHRVDIDRNWNNADFDCGEIRPAAEIVTPRREVEKDLPVP